jgi:tetratricopeptide (TPR) repeat protein
MKRFSLWDKLISIVIGLCVLSGCENAQQRAENREKNGVVLFKKGDFAKAELEFKSALQEDGTLASAYYYLALLNEKDRSYRAMRENLIQAVKLNPENIDARIKLGRVDLLFNQLDAVLIEADEILQRSKNNLDALTLKAAVLIKQKKQGDALAILNDILQKQPQYIEAISLKTLILMQNEQFDTAQKLVSPVIDSDVDNVSLHLLKIQLDSMQNNIEAVVADYEKLSARYPDNLEFKYALAKIYAQANRKQDAENLLRSLVKSAPEEIQPKLVLLSFLNSISKERVIEQIQKDSVENQDKPEVLFQMSQLLLKMRYLPEAQTLLGKIDKLESNTKLQQQAMILSARIAFYTGELEKSKTIVDELIKDNSENQQANILKAKIHIAQEQYDEAVDLLNKALWVDPNSDGALVLLAQVDLAKGNPEKADKKFREALASNPANMDALIPVINRAVRNKNVDYASELLTNAMKLQPYNLTLLRESVEIKMVAGDWKGANKILESLENQPQGELLAKFLRGRVYQGQSDCPQAVSVFKDVLNISPDYPDVLQQMAICYEMMQQRSDMIDYLTSFIEKHPDNISAYLIMGELLLLDKKPEKAVAMYHRALAINEKPPQIYIALARVYVEQKAYNKAIEILKQGLDKTPKNVHLSIYLASVYEKIKAHQDAVALYESLLAVDPRLEIAINNYAALLVDGFGDKQSLEKAQQLVSRFKNSENPFYLDSYAWVELKQGNVNDAVSLLEKVNIMAEAPVFKYHLGVAHHKQGNNAGAVAQLQQAIDMGKQQGDFTEIKLAQQLLDELSMTRSN